MHAPVRWSASPGLRPRSASCICSKRRPLALFWINAGYQLIVYTLMGAILGASH